MARKIKYSKIVAIVFITVLIWAWADLRKTEDFPVSSATISVAKSINPNLWVSFDNDESSVSIERVVLRGSASKVADVERKLNDGSLVLEFFLDPEQEAMTGLGEHTLDVLNFLKQSDQVKRLGLTVESCKPQTIDVKVVKLVKRSLTVRCLDEDKILLKAESEPSKVEMFVPGDWEGEKLTAFVQLTRGEIDQARLAPVEKIPYIRLANDQTRDVPTTVRITTPPQEDPRNDYLITTATLGIALSPSLQEKYKVDVTNLDAVMSAIAIKATPDAKRAYELQPIPTMTLYILDDDKKTTAEQRRKVVYNFPPEYVRRGEIMLNQQPVTARFKLTPLPSGQAPPSAEH